MAASGGSAEARAAAQAATEAVPEYGFFIGGRWEAAAETMPVKHKYTGETLARVGVASREDVRRAVDAAERAFREQRPSPRERAAWLLRTAELIEAHREELGRLIAREAGKPLKEALTEAGRAVNTFTVAAEEAKRIAGELVPIEADPGSEGRFAFAMRVPIGVVAAISPFNFPLNLVAHKVAPALAAGDTVVLKPASATPLTAIRLVELLSEAGVPAGRINLVTGPGSPVGDYLVADPRPALVTFTGSAAVGEQIKARSGLKRVTLELGNNSPNIVHGDADLDLAADRLARQAFLSAGQKCISVQRIYVQRPVLEPFLERLERVTAQLVVGDPEDPATDVGPMISEREAERVEGWIREAVEAGARVLAGGRRRGALLEPTILLDVTPEMKVVCMEAFAPIVTVTPYDTLDEALRYANDTPYGLQAGIFTSSLEVAMRAARELEFGGVIVNDSSAYRADLMPYGGVKGSGIGREGPRYALQEMTELRTVVFNLAK